eukprot:COSAG04_NODE_1308_length_7288_cov_2.749339_7_plen_231_part_00
MWVLVAPPGSRLAADPSNFLQRRRRPAEQWCLATRRGEGRYGQSLKKLEVSSTSPEMLLELVRLQGFKSFAKATEVAFCPHFTCITGPNGSGKSNILDAICFALTEDSLQHLRVRSFSELVSTDADVESGSVALTFSTRAGDDTVKVKLSASVRKEDGSREFKLDGVKKSVKDIRAFLKMEGLDVESKSAILYQNTVMALSEKSGRELAAMVGRPSRARLPDAAGPARAC